MLAWQWGAVISADILWSNIADGDLHQTYRRKVVSRFYILLRCSKVLKTCSNIIRVLRDGDRS